MMRGVNVTGVTLGACTTCWDIVLCGTVLSGDHRSDVKDSDWWCCLALLS